MIVHDAAQTTHAVADRSRLARWRGAWAAAAARHPGLAWLSRWGISAASLCSGALTLVVFRRGLDYFPWFVGYLLLAWLAAVVLVERRRRLAERGHRTTSLVVEYTVQSLLHGLLLFLLPIYYASTTLASKNAWLLVLLAAAALLTTVDPWYRAAARRLPGLETGLFALGLFASLNVAFPLLRLPTAWGLPLSAAASLLALAPLVRRAAGEHGREALALLAAAAIGAGLLCGAARAWFPPVPLHVPRAMFARDVAQLEPVEPLVRAAASDLRGQPVAAFSAVAAPAGLQEGIQHVWRKDGKVVARIPLAVRGGRPGGFRTFSRKADLGPDPAGEWVLEVLTQGGQLIGRARMTLLPDAPPAPRP
ncbi:MAG: DUF2914 domain-containing protein [Candidatus Methylomirabilales bacterium]